MGKLAVEGEIALGLGEIAKKWLTLLLVQHRLQDMAVPCCIFYLSLVHKKKLNRQMSHILHRAKHKGGKY